MEDVFSLFRNEILTADCNAFRGLMRHVAEVNEDRDTVIMVQVENEVGLRGDSRDRSDIAHTTFKAPVPDCIVDKLEKDWDCLNEDIRKVLSPARYKNGGFVRGEGWEGAFGSSQQVDELFMAYHYAQYLNAVAAAGKAEYAVPMFSNCWLPSCEVTAAGGGNSPGIYPSGGPIPSVLDIWQLFCPELDFFSPDGLGGYIPILGWGGDVDQNPCMHTTPYTGSEIQREHNTGIRKCPGGLGKKL